MAVVVLTVLMLMIVMRMSVIVVVLNMPVDTAHIIVVMLMLSIPITMAVSVMPVDTALVIVMVSMPSIPMIVLVLMASTAVLVMMLMVMLMVMLVLMISFLHLGQKICHHGIRLLDDLQKLGSGKLGQGRGDDRSRRIVLTDHGPGRLRLFPIGDIGTAQDDIPRILDLIVKELAEILHVHLALLHIHHGDRAV